MSRENWTPIEEVIRDAVTFPRRRLGEPRDITSEEFDRFLAKHDADLREQIAREIDAERQGVQPEWDGAGFDGSEWGYANGLADAAGVVRRNGASV